MIIASSSSCIIGLTWAGVKFPWSSKQVLAPLIIGLVGMVLFVAYEATLAKAPLVSAILLATTSRLLTISKRADPIYFGL